MIMFDSSIMSKVMNANHVLPFEQALHREKRRLTVQTKEDLLVNR